MRPLLMNPNSSAATTRAMLAIARRILPELMGWTAPEGPEMITDADALARAAVRVGGRICRPWRGSSYRPLAIRGARRWLRG
ncbi:aspartate/glutamate racemase family protein [Salipiger aestuarii]|uniref:aspartate/glutamate racemase family protein n=1 Tax=Salipiger aestuarii TaxID=568098 RepID=UPI001CC28CA8|nr:aspartate/glutamate racemase family protein [Salipiger aestuarii]